MDAQTWTDIEDLTDEERITYAARLEEIARSVREYVISHPRALMLLPPLMPGATLAATGLA